MNHAEYMRIWRQVSHQKYIEIQRRSNRKHADKKSERNRRWRESNPDKYLAHGAVASAIRSGKLIKPDFCQLCLGVGTIHAHHEDYSKQLEIVWLCEICHPAVHGRCKEATVARRAA